MRSLVRYLASRADKEEGPGFMGSGAFFYLCAEGDLNPHALTGTTTST